MVYYGRWKTISVLVVCLLGIIYAAPNLMPRAWVDGAAAVLPAWMPVNQINLGLDLQGGSHLLLEVDTGVVVSEYLDGIVDDLRRGLRSAEIGYTGLGLADGRAVQVTIRDPDQTDRARTIARELTEDLSVSLSGDQLRLQLSDEAFEARAIAAAQQSIEIVRRRIDETGTNEPVIQRQGIDRILVQLPGVDDPERIKRLLGQTAKLNFHLVNEGASITDALGGSVPAGSRLVPAAANNPGQSHYVVERRIMVSGDTLTDSQPTFDRGMPVVSFRFDSTGARRFGTATAENVGRRMAVVLDGEVITAPTIQDAILGGNGIITGQFTVTEANDLSLLLRAGALPAPLTVLEERTVGPGLGQDSIEAGRIACIIAMVMVIAFMALSYGRYGWMANAALAINVCLLFAALSVIGATLTLPGIAGIVLTIGMAVDANVLIFERIREEIRQGRTPINAVDTGYGRAFGTILDANITTLIAAVLLFALGSGPVRGFAVTLGLGIGTSMFSAIMVTRLLVVLHLRQSKPKTLTI